MMWTRRRVRGRAGQRRLSRSASMLRIVAVLLSSLACFLLLRDSYVSWMTEPTKIVVETTSHPVQSVSFPAVTLVSDADERPDRLYFIQKALNEASFQCNRLRSQDDCVSSETIRSTFSFFLSDLLEAFSNASQSERVLGTWSRHRNGVLRHFIPLLLQLLNHSQARPELGEGLQHVEDRLEKCGVGDCIGYLSLSPFAMVKAELARIAQHFNVSAATVEQKELHDLLTRCLEGTLDFEPLSSLKSLKCDVLFNSWMRLAFMSREVFGLKTGSLGSLLHVLAEEFYPDTLKPAYPFPVDFDENRVSTQERRLHRIFANMLEQLDAHFEDEIKKGKKESNSIANTTSISLFDLPALLSSVSPDLPLYDVLPHDLFNFPQGTAPVFTTLANNKTCDKLQLRGYAEKWHIFVTDLIAGFNSKPTSTQSSNTPLTNLTHPCTEDVADSCCFVFTPHLRHEWTLSSALLVMNYALMPVAKPKVPNIVVDEETRSKTKRDEELDLPLIRFCSFEGTRLRRRECEKVFKPVVTDSGIGFAFNAKSNMADNLVSRSLRRVFGVDEDEELLEAEWSGPASGLKLILDKNAVALKRKRGSSFRIGLSNSQDFLLPQTYGLDARTGFVTSVKMVANLIVAKQEVKRHLSVKQRHCRFGDESRSRDFITTYSQAACRFECWLTKTLSVCGCLPYTHVANASDRVCDAFGNHCAHLLLSHVKHSLMECDCLPDCERLTFTFFESPLAIDVDSVCNWDAENADEDLRAVVTKKIDEFIYHPSLKFKRQYDLWVKGEPEASLDTLRSNYCRSIVREDLAVLHVYLATPDLTKSVLDLRVNFTDKLAHIGGTVGIFLGISFLTIVDLVSFVHSICRRLRSQKKQNKIVGINHRLEDRRHDEGHEAVELVQLVPIEAERSRGGVVVY